MALLSRVLFSLLVLSVPLSASLESLSAAINSWEKPSYKYRIDDDCEEEEAKECCCQCEGDFYGGVDYIYYSRRESGGHSRDLIYADNNASQDIPIQPVTRPQGIALNSGAFGHSYEPGYHLTLGFRTGEGGMEANYYHLMESTLTASLAAGDYSLGTQLQNNNHNPNAVNIDTTVASVQNLLSITDVTAEQHQILRSLDVGFLDHSFCGDCRYTTVTYGLRGILIDEDVIMALTTSGGAATYRSEACNYIVGPQLGLDAGYRGCFSGSWEADFRLGAKTGMAVNFSSLSIGFSNGDPSDNPSGPDKTSTVISSFGDVSVSIGVSCRFFDLRVGYGALVVDSVELGGVPSQLFIYGSNPLTAGDLVVYHGVSGGVGFHF